MLRPTTTARILPDSSPVRWRPPLHGGLLRTNRTRCGMCDARRVRARRSSMFRLLGFGGRCVLSALSAGIVLRRMNSRRWWIWSRRRLREWRVDLGALDDWVQLDEAARITGRSVHSVYRWARDGVVGTGRPGDGTWYNVRDLRNAATKTRGRPRK